MAASRERERASSISHDHSAAWANRDRVEYGYQTTSTRRCRPQARFLAVVHAVVNTTPEQFRDLDAEHEAGKEARGVGKPGPKKATTPKHKRKS
jgi:hypothetical protein